MARPLNPLEAAPADDQAEIARLRQTLKEALEEKDRALRLLRRTNTDLFGRVQGQTRQLSSINQLINTINASLDLQQVAHTALAGVHAHLGVEVAALALSDGSGVIQYVACYPETILRTWRAIALQSDDSVIGKALASRQAVVLPGTTSQHRVADLPPEIEARTLLCEPLIVRERVIGALLLVNKASGPFVELDRAFVETVAGSLAIAVENARMYEEVQAQLQTVERSHAELLAAQQQLVRSTKLASVGQLAAGLAHEINNPIGIILGFAQLVGQRTSDEKLLDFATAIEREAVRVKRIVGELLDFAREGAAQTTRLDLCRSVEAALGLLEYQLTRGGIAVQRHFGSEPAWVLADAERIQQVLVNLIQNARQAMPTGGRLTLSTWSAVGRHYVSVADTGPGISAADLERIFDPFFTTKPPGQGTGLGLSVSQAIIQRHRGDLRATSTPGQGATFEFWLPTAPVDLTPNPT